MSTKTVVGLGLLGLAAGGAAAYFGLTPDGLSDEMAKHIVGLDGANALAGSGIDVLTSDEFTKLTANQLKDVAHHFAVDGGQVITFAKDAAGISPDVINSLSTDALRASAQAVNGFAVEPSALVDALKITNVTQANVNDVAAKLGGLIGDVKGAEELAQKALENGGKFTEEALSYIGKTPLDQWALVSKVAPSAIGATAGAIGGAMIPAGEKPVIGPQTQKIMEQRRAALAQQLSANGVQMS